MTPVRFELALSGTSRTDSASETRKLRSLARKARNGVSELGELYLLFSLSAYCMERENIEYEHASVYYPDVHVHIVFYIFYLRRRKLVVKNHNVDIIFPAKVRKLCYLSLSEISSDIGIFLLLGKARDSDSARGIRKTGKLVKGDIIFAFVCTFRYQRDENGAHFFVRTEYIIFFNHKKSSVSA